jgi:hypothetical protein
MLFFPKPFIINLGPPPLKPADPQIARPKRVVFVGTHSVAKAFALIHPGHLACEPAPREIHAL